MPEDRDLDLERCVTDSIKQNTSCKSSVSFKASQRCNIAVQHLDGRAILISANIKEEVNGNLVLSSATRQISQALTKRWYQRLIGKLFMGCVVGTARISKVRNRFFNDDFAYVFLQSLDMATYKNVVPEMRKPRYWNVESTL